jgi:hypothetical protein
VFQRWPLKCLYLGACRFVSLLSKPKYTNLKTAERIRNLERVSVGKLFLNDLLNDLLNDPGSIDG